MKKLIWIFSLVILIIVVFYNKKSNMIIIPSDSIRIRVIANSNSVGNQYEKNIIKEKLNDQLYSLLKDSSSLEQSRDIIINNMENINETIKKSLEELKVNYSFSSKYGLNYFPEKNFKGAKYKEGYYESLVITLGEGNGENWWCVLFPPLCLLEATESQFEEVEYKSFVKKIIDKYFD